MKEIKLTKGYKALVDDEDYELLNKYKWRALIKSNTVYAYRQDKTIIMHRFILNIKDSSIKVDHKDRNGLNNQKNNLRTATQQQNCFNRGKAKNNTSGYKGVTHCGLKWKAQIRINKKLIYLGVFTDKKEAAIAYDKAAIKYQKDFAFLNFKKETMNKIDRNYCVLKILSTEAGVLIVRPNNTEKHLVYISEDREVFLKDDNNLTNAEISYIKDFAKNSPHLSLKSIEKKEAMLGHMKYHKYFTEAGFSGVLPNGYIVDRRIYPNAILMQKNSLFGIPTPKINLK